MAEKDASTHSWLMERRSFSLGIVLIFVILSIVTFFLCSRHHATSMEETLKDDRSTAKLLALVLDEHLKKIVSTMESYANRPLLLKAVKDKNAEKARVHLISLTKSDSGIDILIITDRKGTLWTAYPPRPESLGQNFAYRDWYLNVSKNWKPSISDVTLRVVREKDLAFQISVPFVNEKREVIGILTNTQRTIGLNDTFKQVPLDPGSSISLTDRKGQIIYSSRYVYENEIRPYPFYPGMKEGTAAKNHTFAADDPDLGGATRYISYAPVGNIGWTVFVGRDRRSILLSESEYYIQVTAIAFLLFLSIVLILAYLRKQVTARQIREQLQAAKELQTSEERFRELFDHMSNGVAVYQAINDGEDFIIVDLNDAAQRVTRVYTDFIGKSVCDVFPGVKPLGLFKIFQRVWETGRAEYYPSSQYKDDRLTFWVENYVYKLPSGEIVAIFDDITERKEAETQNLLAQEVLELLNRPSGSTDIIRDILQRIKKSRDFEAVGIRLREGDDFPYYQTNGFSEAFVQAERHLCAYDEEGKIIRDAQGTPVLDCMCGNILRGRTNPTMPFFTEGGSFWSNCTSELLASTTEEDRQARTRNRCNGEGYESVALIPLRSGDEIIGLLQLNDRRSNQFTLEIIRFFEGLGASIGIALSRKRVEEEIIKLNTELEQRVMDRTAQLSVANKELEAFSYSVSHDLRAPLRSIDGFSHALLEEYQDKLDDAGRGYLERVRKATQRMGFLIDDILKLARMSQAEMKHEAVNVSGMIREIAEAQRKSNPDRAVDVAVQEGIIFQGDPYLIKIAMENLVDNAFKFTGKKAHPRIEFGTTVRDGETACFIRDNGAGFDMAYGGKLFGAFQRLHPKEEFAGTGIGLATVQRIIHRHGGRVWAKGEVGKGATFCFTLPG